MADGNLFQSSLQKQLVRHLCRQPHDLVVYVGRQRFKCHQALLTSMSEYFCNALSGSCTETREPAGNMTGMRIVTLHDEKVTAESFRLFLSMLYNDDMETAINADTAVGLINMAFYLKIEILKHLCMKYLESWISSPTTTAPLQSILGSQIWFLATLHGNRSLELAVMNKAAVEPKDLVVILEQENIVDVSGEKLLSLMRSVIRHDVKTMSCLLTSIFHWAIRDMQARKATLKEMLDHILFQLVTDDILTKVGEDVLLISPCLDMVKDYLQEETQIRTRSIPDQKREASPGNFIGQSEMEKYIIVPQGFGVSPYACIELINSSDECFAPYFMPLAPAPSNVIGQQPNRGCFEEELFEVGKVKSRFIRTMLEHMRSVKPFSTGMWHTSACVWRNELYISGGAKAPRTFAVYRPRTSDWESLPDLPLDCERHSMAACNDQIYIIGVPLSCCHQVSCQKAWCQHLSVLVYSIQSRTWRRFFSVVKSNTAGPQTANRNHCHQEQATDEQQPVNCRVYALREESLPSRCPRNTANKQHPSQTSSFTLHADSSQEHNLNDYISHETSSRQPVGFIQKPLKRNRSQKNSVWEVHSSNRNDDNGRSACEVYASSSCPDHSDDFMYDSPVSTISFQYPDRQSPVAKGCRFPKISSIRKPGNNATVKQSQRKQVTSNAEGTSSVSITSNIVNIYLQESKNQDKRKPRTPVAYGAKENAVVSTDLLGLLNSASVLLSSASDFASGFDGAAEDENPSVYSQNSDTSVYNYESSTPRHVNRATLFPSGPPATAQNCNACPHNHSSTKSTPFSSSPRVQEINTGVNPMFSSPPSTTCWKNVPGSSSRVGVQATCHENIRDHLSPMSDHQKPTSTLQDVCAGNMSSFQHSPPPSYETVLASPPRCSPQTCVATTLHGARHVLAHRSPGRAERLDCVHPMQARTAVVGNRFILVFCPPDNETYEDYVSHTSGFGLRSLVKSIDTVTGAVVKAGVVPFVPVAIPIIDEGNSAVVIAFRGDVTFWRMTVDVEKLKKRSERNESGNKDSNTPNNSADLETLLKTEPLSSETVRQQWGHLGTFLDEFFIVAKMVHHPRFMYSDLHPACLQTMFLPTA